MLGEGGTTSVSEGRRRKRDGRERNGRVWIEISNAFGMELLGISSAPAPSSTEMPLLFRTC